MSKASYLQQHHDFAKPWAKQRVAIYKVCFAVSTIIAVGVIVGVGLRWFPAIPETGAVACFLFITPIFVAFATAWRDVPGEKRTILEKANEFQMIWFVVAAAASEAWWETAWLVGDVMGKMNLPQTSPLPDEQRWMFIFYYYGAADIRYLESDGALFALEIAAVAGAFIMTAAWWKLRKAGNDPAARIKPLWWCFFTMSMMLTVFFIYYVAEFRHGFANFPRHGWMDIVLILGYENVPWIVAPMISLPFVAMQLGYLYRQLPPAAPLAEASPVATDLQAPRPRTAPDVEVQSPIKV